MAEILADFLKKTFVARPDDYVYAAALIDGEGCICIERRRPNGRELTPKYTATVSVEMTDFEPVRFMKQLFGGHTSKRLRFVNNKELMVWSVASQKAGKALRQILPHLKIGRKQRAALACLELLKTRTVSKKLGTTPETLARRETLYQICREVNKRGGTSD